MGRTRSQGNLTPLLAKPAAAGYHVIGLDRKKLTALTMRILLINPPYVTFTSRFGVGHQIPLGLLMVGGALLDRGHEVELLDAERRHLKTSAIIREVRAFAPHIVMTGHAGSTPAHPICLEMLSAIKRSCPQVTTVYGGVYPTYHAPEILSAEAAVDFIVRGEGEETAVALVEALESQPEYRPAATRNLPLAYGDSIPAPSLQSVRGISYRVGDRIAHNPDSVPISDLDGYRTGWELIRNWADYQCFGLGRAAIVQFSRGCPHRCTYCGQHGFWVNWRHRDPARLVDEIEWLHRTHGVRFCTIADENPTTIRPLWQRFLEEMASRHLPVKFFATIRATDIVRDADIMPLYREAGLLYVLMGIDSTEPEVLKEIRKGSTTRHDFLACRLLKQHGIYSVLGHIVGLEDDSWAGLGAALKQLKHYDGDYLNAMYATPHSWTEFGRAAVSRRIVQPDQRRWDYRHQVLEQPNLKPWQLFAGVKWLELRFHLRVTKLRDLLFARNRFNRRQVMWGLSHTGLVWLAEIGEFLSANLRRSRHKRAIQMQLSQYNTETFPPSIPPADS